MWGRGCDGVSKSVTGGVFHPLFPSPSCGKSVRKGNLPRRVDGEGAPEDELNAGLTSTQLFGAPAVRCLRTGMTTTSLAHGCYAPEDLRRAWRTLHRQL